jgi:hypothetical protein
MVDRNMRDFHGRLGRIDDIHSHGGGFEADGVLGMSYYNARRRRRSRLPRLLSLLILLTCFLFAMKTAMHVALGPDLYDYKITELRQGTDVDRIGAWILQADPVTIALAHRVRGFIH